MNATSDELDQMADEQLNELFAVEVAGYVVWPEGTGFLRDVEGPNPRLLRHVTDKALQFTTDANAVLPWLEKHGWEATGGAPFGSVLLQIHSRHVGHAVVKYHGESPTFARAAVIALLRAKRSSK